MIIRTLQEIWIYPIKSLSGISLTTANVMGKGLQHDRRFMLVDEHNVFITQRNLSVLALFRVSLQNDLITVRHQEHAISFPIMPVAGNGEVVQLWDDQIITHEVDKQYSAWFSDQLKMTCKLVYFPEENERPVDPKYQVNNEQVSLADGYPYLIIGQRSLDDLNTRLEQPVPMNRFRPNFVFTGGEPYEEDSWKNFTIGTNRFIGTKPCARCTLTTVDQRTGLKGVEPLKTLATYRNYNHKIHFGQNSIARDHGSVKVGDRIILE